MVILRKKVFGGLNVSEMGEHSSKIISIWLFIAIINNHLEVSNQLTVLSLACCAAGPLA